MNHFKPILLYKECHSVIVKVVTVITFQEWPRRGDMYFILRKSTMTFFGK